RMCHRARAAHGFKFLQIGAPADDFRLPAIQSDRLIQLSEFHGRKPVVLIFASFTCNIFSKNAARLEQLYQAFKNRAEFLCVQIRKAERDEEPMASAYCRRRLDGLEDRREWAREAMAMLRFTVPGVIDTEEGQVERAYGAYPLRLLVVGQDGRIVMDAGIGIPNGWDYAELERWLQAYLG